MTVKQLQKILEKCKPSSPIVVQDGVVFMNIQEISVNLSKNDQVVVVVGRDEETPDDL